MKKVKNDKKGPVHSRKIFRNGGNSTEHEQDVDSDNDIRDFNRFVDEYPNDTIAWFMRGYAWLKKGKQDKAISDFDEAIRLDPSFASAWHGRGCAKLTKSEVDKAIGDLDEAIRLNPSYAGTWLDRSVAWEKKTKQIKSSLILMKSFT